jgi:tetratricopeptide (TPR) repeat protein
MRTLRPICGIVFTLAAARWFAPPCAAEEQFYKGLGTYTRTVTTSSPEAKRYFNQGLAFLHGFNHGAAIRSFQAAARLDPACAMAHWGIALACGPHINFPLVPPPAAELAWRELGLARASAHATPRERELIEALGTRYASPQPEDRSALDRAYAKAMGQLWRAHPDDADIGALYAESMMDLRPWDQWTADGKPQPGTDEILATLRAVLKLNPRHPFANHLYIHAVEASPHPEWADAAADRLRTMQPGVAHNVHMPSHIDIRRGRWQAAIEANLKAVEADRRYRQIVGPPTGILPMYIAHNEHMLAYAAMMSGQSRLAIAHIRAMVAGVPPDFIKQYAPLAEGFVAMPLEVLVRFGKWDEVLAEPDIYPDYMPFTRAFHHAAQAAAYAAKGDVAAARREQAIFADRARLVAKEESFGNNSAAALLELAAHMVEGEILLREGASEKGLAELRAAVAAEDALKYDEPPGWLIPMRHSLGASLVAAKRYAEAEQVYRADLVRLPEDGWALFGLSQSLHAQDKHAEAARATARFRKAWASADLQITSSCLCQPGK